MRWILLLLLALAAGCDREVSRTVFRDQMAVVKTSQSCNAGPGYCYACAMGFDGKFQCSFGLKHSCPGSQPVTVERTPVAINYESGKVLRSHVDRRVSVDGDCK